MTPACGWSAWWVRVVLLGSAFAVADALAALTSGPGSGVAGVWIPGGIGLAGLLLGGMSLWPGLVVGGIMAAPAYGPLSAASVPVVVANMLAVLLAAWAIQGLGTDMRLGRLGDVARFGLGCLVGAIPMGLVGVLTLLSLGGTEEGPVGSVIALWQPTGWRAGNLRKWSWPDGFFVPAELRLLHSLCSIQMGLWPRLGQPSSVSILAQPPSSPKGHAPAM